MFAINRFANKKRAHILQYGTGSTITIIGFAIWPDLTSMQLLNHAIKTRSTVYTGLLALRQTSSNQSKGTCEVHVNMVSMKFWRLYSP